MTANQLSFKVFLLLFVHKKKRRIFFFEKKKQKTFERLLVA